MNNTFTIIDINCNLKHTDQEKESRFVFTREIKQAMLRKKEIEAIDRSVKD